MKIRELLEISPQIISIRITIRNNGLYNYEYHIGEKVRLTSSYGSHRMLDKGEIIRFNRNNWAMPATFWAIDPRKIDNDLLELTITNLRLWNAPSYTDAGGWSAVEALITCDIGNKEFFGLCTRVVEDEKPKIDLERDQMSLEDFLEG